jgi:hypothetical protein
MWHEFLDDYDLDVAGVDLPASVEEFLRGLEWHTDVGSKSPRAEISDIVTTYNSYDVLPRADHGARVDGL